MPESSTNRVGWYPWAVLAILFLVYVSNQWDRYIFNYVYNVNVDDCIGKNDTSVCDPTYYSLKEATGIDSAQYGILSGPAFTAVYVCAGLAAGRMTDIMNRRNLLTVALIVWSLATAAMGLAENFGHLLACRAVLGIGQAFSAPPAYSLIAEYFAKEKRGQANGMYAFGVYVGGGLSSISLAMSNGIGWRNTCYFCGAFGVGVALLLLAVVREPGRAAKEQQSNLQSDLLAQEEEQQRTLWESLKVIFKPTTVQLLMVAAALRFVGGYAIGSFLPTYYKDYHPDFGGNNNTYSVLNAFVVSTGGALSSWAGGYIGDKWSARDPRARAWVPAIGALLAIPCMALCLFSSNFYASMTGLFFAYLTAECWFGPAFSVLQNELPGNVRGLASSTYIFITTLVGSTAPYIIGEVDKTVDNLPWEIFTAVLISYGGCAVVFGALGTALKKAAPLDSDDDMAKALLGEDVDDGMLTQEDVHDFDDM